MNKTETFYLELDSATATNRNSLPYGSATEDPRIAEDDWYRLYEDTPESPGPYYDFQIGELSIIDSPDYPGTMAISRVDNWVEWDAQRKRDAIKESAFSQIRQFSDADKSNDSTLQWVTEFDYNRYKIVAETLAQTGDEDLDTFDYTLSSYDQSEQDYAKTMARQETATLAWDTELKAAGDEGILNETERLEVEARVSTNANVYRGLDTGVRTPEHGAPRSLAALDGEEAEQARFWETSFEWATQDYFIPVVVLEEMPAGVNTDQVFAMIYDANNVYRSWMPFAQQPDGTWRTPSNVSNVSIGKTESSSWRVAVSYEGTTSEYEITERVSIVPPNSAWSQVRWGGRT